MPKLTRVAGFEWGTGFFINPTPPEDAARFLRQAGRAGAPSADGLRALTLGGALLESACVERE